MNTNLANLIILTETLKFTGTKSLHGTILKPTEKLWCQNRVNTCLCSKKYEVHDIVYFVLNSSLSSQRSHDILFEDISALNSGLEMHRWYTIFATCRNTCVFPIMNEKIHLIELIRQQKSQIKKRLL